MIEINNLTTVSVDENFLKLAARKVLGGEKKKNKDLSVALIGQGKIRELNKKYRGKNRTTDILSFSQNQKFPIVPRNQLSLGEIVICPREVIKNAKKFNSTFKKESARVLIHGILHLLGYDHEKGEEAAERMKKKEDYYLQQLKI